MNIGRLLGGIFLVAGTAIGVGMLAMPVTTGLAGLCPALFLFFISWFFMMFTAFLFLEISFWMEEGTDLISMAEQTLGSIGKWIGTTIYLMLLYALLTAYVGGSTRLFEEAVKEWLSMDLPRWFAPLPVLFFFGLIVYLGTKSVDYLNRILMMALVLTYFFLVVYVPPHIDVSLYGHQDWDYLLVSVSVIVTSFGFHIVIPSLSTYLGGNATNLKIVLFVGSVIPLFVYIVWEMLVLGVVPLEGENGLIQAWVKDSPATDSLREVLKMPWISILARFFAFFSITTSFLGVSLSMTHFLSDGMKVKRESPFARLLIIMLTFLPPLVFIFIGSRVFYVALEYAGIFVSILLGILPICMVWVGRYKQRRSQEFRTPGGRILLVCAFVFFALVVILEIATKLNLLHFVVSEYVV